jgi:aspartate beta-hydroxylase
MSMIDASAELEALLQAYCQATPRRADRLQALQSWLQTHADAGEAATEDIEQFLHHHPREPYLRLLLAQAHLAARQRLKALQCWQRASSMRDELTDGDQLQVLGLGHAGSAQAQSARFVDLRAEYLQDSFADIRRGTAPRELFRIERALAGYLGKASVFSSHPMQRPKYMFIPGLRGVGYLDPAWHPLVKPLEAAAAGLRAEFDQAVESGLGIEPFLGDTAGGAAGAYVTGGAKASWDALFFYRHGQRFDENHRRFPFTSHTLDVLDLCRIDGQAPEICYSILQPGTRIEPHHGVTNARVVVHIPLRIPPGCFLEVTGVGRHYWHEGRAMVFDDTFQHSAENPSDQVRGILLMDSWHPDLTELERRAFRALVEATTRIESLSLN